MYGLYFINSILCELFLRFFCVMYRLIPCTPASLCSVHSNVTCNRTSFFFEAAMTCKAPLLEDVDVFAEEENAEVDTREDKIDWESAFISLCLWIARRIKPKDDGIKQEEEEEEDVSVKTSSKNQRERRKIQPGAPDDFARRREREREPPTALFQKKNRAI
jgi:hypothetical protein